jgi:hypothetical protein
VDTLLGISAFFDNIDKFLIHNIMSLTARLHIEGHSEEKKGIKILSCDFSFSQETDSEGRVSSSVRSGLINITIQGINDSEIFQWMLGQEMRKNGKISFSGVVATGPHKTLEFEDAVLVHYHESFTDQSDVIIDLSISCRKINIAGASHEHMWDFGQD